MRKSVCIIFLMIGISLSAQNVAVKTNLLYDATTTFNLGAEIGLSPRWTLDLSANYNPFSFSDNKKWKHWMAQPEARYWFCERFNGHFMGLHLLGGQYNVGGVKLPFGIYPRWRTTAMRLLLRRGPCLRLPVSAGQALELRGNLGLGYVRAHYDRYDCPRCGEWKGKGDKNYLGVTKAAISLIYVIK